MGQNILIVYKGMKTKLRSGKQTCKAKIKAPPSYHSKIE